MEIEVMREKTATNVLPKGWKVVPIEECLATINGKKKVGQGWSPQCEKEASPSDDQWGVLKTTAIQAGEFLQDENKLLPATLDPRPQNEVKPGDLLTTCAGPRSRCGVTCLVRETRPRLMISGKMYRYRAKEGFVDAEYLEAYLQTQDAWDAIDKMKTGGSDSGLNLTHERFLQLPIPLAPLPQQRRIVSAIELQLGRLDAAVARLHGAKAKLKRYKQAVLKAAFTENDWPVTSIGDVYEVFVGSTPSRAKPALWNGNVPWVSSGEVAFCEIHETREKIAHEALNNSEKRLHPSGTVMLAMIGEGKTRGQAAILRIPAAHNQNTAAIRMPDILHSPEYLYYFFLYEYENTRRVGSGNNQMALNKTRIQAIEIPMPDPETQARVALEIAERLDQVDAMETTLDAELLRSTRLRQAVLKRAFEGRLV